MIDWIYVFAIIISIAILGISGVISYIYYIKMKKLLEEYYK